MFSYSSFPLVFIFLFVLFHLFGMLYKAFLLELIDLFADERELICFDNCDKIPKKSFIKHPKGISHVITIFSLSTKTMPVLGFQIELNFYCLHAGIHTKFHVFC